MNKSSELCEDFVRGNNFRDMCDHVLSINPRENPETNLLDFIEKIDLIQENDLVFCKGEYIINEGFKQVLEKLPVKVNLLIHKADYLIHHRWLDNEKLVNVFSANLNCNLLNSKNTRFFPLPWGFVHHDVEQWPDSSKEQMQTILNKKLSKNIHLYVPFHSTDEGNYPPNGSIRTHFLKELGEWGIDKPYIVNSKQRKSFEEYYNDLENSKFSIVVPGAGWGNDPVRYWECALRKCIPVSKKRSHENGWKSGVEHMCKEHNIPFLFVDEWKELNHDLLNYKNFDTKIFEKIVKQKYWNDFISSIVEKTK